MITAPVQTNVACRLRSERGVTLIHVAASIFILMGFSAFVLDHGVLMLSRGQAQNVADMAALAGGIARATDEPLFDMGPNAGITVEVIEESVNRHTIFAGTSEDTGRTPHPNLLPCPVGVFCVKVDVFRDGTHESTTLPVYLASLFAVPFQKMRATATAYAVPANGSRCMKPWLIPDRWQENGPVPSPFDPMVDQYAPPVYGTPVPGTGYSHNDFFTPIKIASAGPLPTIVARDLWEFVDAEESDITGCQVIRRIGDNVEVRRAGGITNGGVSQLTLPVDAVIGVFNPAQLAALDPDAETFDLTIMNMINVRITGWNGSQLTGVITGGIGDRIAGGLTPGGTASMIKKVELVR